MKKCYKIVSWLSIIIFLGYFFLLMKELLSGELSFSELAIIPIILGIILIIDFIISLLIVKNKILSHIFIFIIQTSIILYCLYLIYYYSFNTFPMIIDSTLSH